MRHFRRGGSRRRGTSRPIRNREWTAFTTTQVGLTYDQPRSAVLTAGQVFKAWVLDPDYVQTQWDEPTIVRTLLAPQMFLNATTAQIAGDYRMTLRWGLITWKGATDVALPATGLDGVEPSDPTMDWMIWGEVHFNHFLTNNLGTNEADFSGNSGWIDVRSKRKLERGYGLALGFKCLADSIPATAVGFEIFMSGRILLLNH